MTVRPSAQNLQEMARHFVGQDFRSGHASLPDSELQVDTMDGTEVYAWRGAGGQNATLYKAAGGEKVAEAAALTPDGKRVLFGLSGNGQDEVVSVPVRLGVGGWLSRQVSNPQVVARLPEPVTDLEVGDRGQLAIACRDKVRELRNGQLSAPLTLPEEIGDLQYLSDGSLAVCTGPADRYHQDGRRYFWTPDAATAPVEVTLADVSLEAYEKSLRQRTTAAYFLRERPLAEVERFEREADWLRDGEKFKSNRSFENPADPDMVGVLVKEPQGLSLWSYRHSDGAAACLGALEGEDPHAVQGVWAPDGSALGVWSVPGSEDMRAKATTAHIFQVAGEDAGQKTVLPGIEGLLVHEGRGALNFETPQGRVEIALTDAPMAAEQPWFAEAIERHEQALRGQLLESAPPEATGEIAVAEEYVDINGVRVPVAGAAEPPLPAPPAPETPPEALPVAAEPLAAASEETLDELMARLGDAKGEYERVMELKDAAWKAQYDAEVEVRHWLERNGWELPER